MTWQPGASFIRQRCNRCGGSPADYCAATDEYLYEPCFEFAVEMVEEPVKYAIRTGRDGKHYAVFENSYQTSLSAYAFRGCSIACFGGYENAYELTPDWWWSNLK